MSLTWAVGVNWNGDGETMVEEASRVIDLHSKRGRDNYLRVDGDGNAIGYEHIQSGTCSVTLLNTDGRFDPYNTSSPLYPYILPGRRAEVWVTNNDSGLKYPVIAGNISVPRPTSGELSTCTIDIVDGMDILNKQTANVDTKAAIRIDTAIDQILTAISWPAVWGSSLEIATDRLPYWWADSRAVQEITDLADADMGWFFVAANGKATFFDRYHAGTALTTITQDMIGKEILLPQPWDVVRNRVAVVAHPLTSGPAGSELWRMSDIPLINPGETKTYLVNYVYNGYSVAAYPAIVPVATTDFTVNTAANGSGTDLTSSCTSGLTSLGTLGFLTITNNSGSIGYITLAKVRGTPVYSLTSVTAQKDNAASQSLYKIRLLTVDSRWQENAYKAEDQANWLKTFLGNPLAFPQITVESRPGVQFIPDLFSLQPLTITQLGISGNFYVSSIEHKWLNASGQAVLTKLGLEPSADLSGYWRFTAQIGVTTRFGV